MNKLNYIIFLFFCLTSFLHAGEKNISFLTVVGPSLRDVKIQAHNTAYINGMKIIGTRTVKTGDTWITTVKITDKYQ